MAVVADVRLRSVTGKVQPLKFHSGLHPLAGIAGDFSATGEVVLQKGLLMTRRKKRINSRLRAIYLSRAFRLGAAGQTDRCCFQQRDGLGSRAQAEMIKLRNLKCKTAARVKGNYPERALLVVFAMPGQIF